MSSENGSSQKSNLGARYRIETMRPEDVPAVVEIERASFSNPWPEEAFVEEVRKNAFSYPMVARSIASAERTIVGYCIPWVVYQELHVQNVAVHSDHRGQGLGRHLVEEALALGRQSGCRIAVLEVRESNEIARSLYTSMGFREWGKRRKYYRRPQEHAIVYQKDLLA